MKWVEAVKIWNHGKRTVNTSHGWFVPKAGTKEYEEVREIMKMEKTPEHEKILSVKSERTVKRAERKAAIKRGEKPKRTRKPKEVKEEPKGLSEAERKAEEAKYEGMNKDRRAKALEQLKAFEKQIQESNLEKAKKAEALARVAKAKEDIEASVKPIREAKAKGGFRGQIIQKQRSKYLTLLKDIEFFSFDKQSPLNSEKVNKQFLKDDKKVIMLYDKFRIYKNLDKLTKDKFILDQKEELEKKREEKKAKTPFNVNVESRAELQDAMKRVFDGDAPKIQMEEKKEVMEEKKEEKEEAESSSDEEDSLESKEKRLSKLKENMAYWEDRMKNENLGSGVKKEQAKLKAQIKKLEKEIAELKKGSVVMKKEDYKKEHKKLIDILEKAGKEGEEQKKEVAAVMKQDLPPPSTKSKEEDAMKKIKDDIEERVERVAEAPNMTEISMLMRGTGNGIFYAAKNPKDLGKKGLKKYTEEVMFIMELVKNKKAMDKIKDLIGDTATGEELEKLVIHKGWEKYIKSL